MAKPPIRRGKPGGRQGGLEEIFRKFAARLALR